VTTLHRCHDLAVTTDEDAYLDRLHEAREADRDEHRCDVCGCVFPAGEVVNGECGGCYTAADDAYRRVIDP